MILCLFIYNQNGAGCYTLCNPIPKLRSLFPLVPFLFPRPLLHIHYFPIPYSNFNPLIRSWNSICLTLPNLPVSCPFPIYPDQRFHNPILDLLIPLAVLMTLHCSQ